ncbi:MAG: peptidoglycan-binding domain-containing protein, partial [Acidobacteriota bacterium]|nr:peptidoglycan-binding domain-containing protein [Acidobacteriota bacterium]
MRTATLVVVLAALMALPAAAQNRRAAEEVELERIFADAPATEVALGLDDPTRRQIQRNLIVLGFNPGPADGQFGPRTRRAIAAWQGSQGAPETGYLNEAQVAALMGGGQLAVPELAAQPLTPELSRVEDPDLDGEPTAPPPAMVNPEIELVFWQSI